MTGRMEENDMGRKKQISDQKRLHRERMRLQKGVFSSLATSPFTILDSGEMFAEQIITVIGGIIEKELDAREKAQQERMKKYTEKYTG